MGEIINQIWQLPWYKVFIIAVADDAILFIKLWPAWVGLIICGLAVAIWLDRKGYKGIGGIRVK